jgi:Cu+-exporting ATPase
MTCASCVARVESALRSVPGVESARVNLATESASVHAAASIEPQQLVGAVQAAGYDAVAGGVGSDTASERRQEQHLRERRQALITAVGIGLPIMALHWLGHRLAGTHEGGHFWPMLLQGLLTVMLLISPAGGPIIVGGIRALLRRSPNMDLLIALGVLAATFGSFAGLLVPQLAHANYFHDAAMILGFINLGKYIEARSRARAASSLSALLKRVPRRAVRIEPDGSREVPIELIQPGDRLQVAAESYVPVDGRVISGHAAVDMSMWTGESTPLDVERDGEVLGGSYVHSGAVTMEATAAGADSAISRIARMVEEAQTGKTQMQAIADRVAAVFVPIVVLLAVLTCIGWLIAGGGGAAAWSAMIAVLVVACPCAMGLATPMAVMVATGSAALRGIIVRDPAVLERAAGCQVALLDKTGTITTGQIKVQGVYPKGEFSEAEILRLGGAAEQFSMHPLARAITAAARGRGIELPEPTQYDVHAGLGVKVTIEDRVVHVGSADYLEREGIIKGRGNLVPQLRQDTGSDHTGQPSDARASSHQGVDSIFGTDPVPMNPEPPSADLGGTYVFVAVDGLLAGVIVLRDEPRTEARETVNRLRQLNVRPMMVTGDQEEAAHTIARAVGIEEIFAGVSPPGKADLVRRLQGEGLRVLMVGDGINDAPALAAADVGVAMSGGTQVAAETAAIALAGDRIELVPETIELARRSVRIIRQNLFWAFAYNVVAIPLAMLLILPAAYAAAAMMFSSISVVLNSLRLQRLRS